MKKSNLALSFLEAVGKANEKLMSDAGAKIRTMGWRIFECCWDPVTQAEAEKRFTEGTFVAKS